MNRTARARRKAARKRVVPEREKVAPAVRERIFARPGRLGALRAGSIRARGRAAPAARNRIFAHPERLRRAGPPQFDPVASPATLAGSTPHFHVYYASVLGQAGDKVAQAVLKNCERDYKILSGFFGQQQELAFNIVVAPLSQQMDGSGGAYHHTCLATDLYCDVQLTPNMDPDLTNALVIAEEVEVFEAVQGAGWQCGGSNGEGLSRVLASELYPNVLENLGYATARFWLNSRRPNFVGRTLPSDRNMIANGCAVLFLNYLHVQLGFGWDKICQAAAPTLALTYKALTGKSAPFPAFVALLEKKFPKGQRTDLATDNPFPIK
jgi:hypothetical protein